MDTQDINYGLQQAAAQFSSIREMVAALEVDYDRLEELREERAELLKAETEAEEAHEAVKTDDSHAALIAAQIAISEWAEQNEQELTELESEAGDCVNRDEASDFIHESPLSLQVRSGWYTPGETPEPEEFEILLCTGGPAVRILGELNEHGEPSRAWLEYQDWSTPWTHYYEEGAANVLLTYCQQFYFGE